MKLLRLLLPALLAATPAAAQRAALFGVYDPDAFIEGNATHFMGCHDGRQFHADGCPVDVDTLRVGDELPGAGADGRFSLVEVNRVRRLTGDLYQAPYTVTVREGTGPVGAAPILFWQPRPSVQLVAWQPAELDSTALALLRAEAVRLHGRAETQRASGERSDSLMLATPSARQVDGEARLVVFWPAALAYGDETDDRASFFFIYDPRSRRVVSGRFGHPEWAPLPERADVAVVEPLLFFRVGGDGRTYILARDNGPWERIGFGVFELRSGDRVLRSR